MSIESKNDYFRVLSCLVPINLFGPGGMYSWGERWGKETPTAHKKSENKFSVGNCSKCPKTCFKHKTGTVNFFYKSNIKLEFIFTYSFTYSEKWNFRL